jgi:4'-phosphopantetheinyl transferase EntD
MPELCAELAALFPLGAVAAQLPGIAQPADLRPDEMQAVSHCSEKRIGDFAAGRLCARRALRQFGIEGFSLLPARDRQPLWPTGITGSITHTEGYAAAVVIRRGNLRSVGLDSERISAVHVGLWSRICAPVELERLRAVADTGRGERAAVTFAAKEAFYKSQFPLTGEWLGFADVAIELDEAPDGGGVFVVVPQRALLLQRQGVQRLTGRYRRHGGFVSAGIALC